MHSPSSRRILALSKCAAVMVCGVVSTGSAYAASLEVAYAHVFGNGTLDAVDSKNVIAMAGGNGLYCFKLKFKPKSAVATLADDPTAASQGVGFIKVALPPTPTFTCNTIPQPDAVVETGSETAVNSGESNGGYAFYVYWTK